MEDNSDCQWYVTAAPGNLYSCPAHDKGEPKSIKGISKGDLTFVCYYQRVIKKQTDEFEVKQERRLFHCNLHCIDLQNTENFHKFTNAKEMTGRFIINVGLDENTQRRLNERFPSMSFMSQVDDNASGELSSVTVNVAEPLMSQVDANIPSSSGLSSVTVNLAGQDNIYLTGLENSDFFDETMNVNERNNTPKGRIQGDELQNKDLDTENDSQTKQDQDQIDTSIQSQETIQDSSITTDPDYNPSSEPRSESISSDMSEK